MVRPSLYRIIQIEFNPSNFHLSRYSEPPRTTLIQGNVEYPVVIRWNFYVPSVEYAYPPTTKCPKKKAELEYNVLARSVPSLFRLIRWMAKVVGSKEHKRIVHD